MNKSLTHGGNSNGQGSAMAAVSSFPSDPERELGAEPSPSPLNQNAETSLPFPKAKPQLRGCSHLHLGHFFCLSSVRVVAIS